MKDKNVKYDEFLTLWATNYCIEPILTKFSIQQFFFLGGGHQIFEIQYGGRLVEKYQKLFSFNHFSSDQILNLG